MSLIDFLKKEGGPVEITATSISGVMEGGLASIFNPGFARDSISEIKYLFLHPGHRFKIFEDSLEVARGTSNFFGYIAGLAICSDYLLNHTNHILGYVPLATNLISAVGQYSKGLNQK